MSWYFIRDNCEYNLLFSIQMKAKDNKPLIETMINTSALALTATGTAWVVNGLVHNGLGFCLILFGASLEFLKYYGRKNNYW